LEPQEKGLSKM